MSKTKMSLIISVLTLGISVNVNAKTYQSADNTRESNLCVAAATASKIGMYNRAKDYKPSIMGHHNLRYLANNLYCNGVNVADFAKDAGNDAVFTQLNSIA